MKLNASLFVTLARVWRAKSPGSGDAGRPLAAALNEVEGLGAAVVPSLGSGRRNERRLARQPRAGMTHEEAAEA